MSELILSKYPEGWEEAKSLLKDIPEEEREAFMFGYMMLVLTN